MATNFNADQHQIEIPLSKTKLFFLLLVSIAFVSGGLFFILFPAEFQDSGLHYRPKLEILILGYLCVIFFGAGLFVFVFQMFNKKPGLVINDQGIIINPGMFSTTFIDWKLIQGFGIISISRSKLIAIYLKEPKDYIDTLNSSWKRKLASFNLKNYGTPISITANSLKCDTKELNILLIEKLTKVTLSRHPIQN